jgi:hypothetical protein
VAPFPGRLGIPLEARRMAFTFAFGGKKRKRNIKRKENLMVSSQDWH